MNLTEKQALAKCISLIKGYNSNLPSLEKRHDVLCGIYRECCLPIIVLSNRDLVFTRLVSPSWKCLSDAFNQYFECRYQVNCGFSTGILTSLYSPLPSQLPVFYLLYDQPLTSIESLLRKKVCDDPANPKELVLQNLDHGNQYFIVEDQTGQYHLSWLGEPLYAERFDEVGPSIMEVALVRKDERFFHIKPFERGQHLYSQTYEDATSYNDRGLAEVAFNGEVFTIDLNGERVEE